MRIGMIAPLGRTFDAFFQEITQEWEREGHSVFLLSGKPARHLDVEINTSVTRRPAPRNITAPGQIEKWARKNDLDVILANTATGAALPRVRPISVPVVYFCHGLHWNRGTSLTERFWMTIENYLLRNTHAVLCMNSDDRTWFSERFDTNRIFYLNHGVGVPLEKYTPTPLPAGETLKLLWAGEFSARKRPHLMLEVARLLKDRGVAFDLQMLGRGSLHDDVGRNVHELGLEGEVSLPGHQPIQDYMHNSHLFLHTSSWEGLPRVMLEARAMRRQSIAFDVKGSRDIPDLIKVPDTDIQAFASAIIDQRAKVLGKDYSLPAVPEEMDSANVARSITDFLRSVI